MTAQNIEAFLHDGGSVCPFARTCKLIYVDTSQIPKNDRSALVKAVKQFSPTMGSTPPAALIVGGPMSTNFEETKEWAIQVFLELHTVLWLGIGLTLTSLEAYVKNEVEPMVRDDSSQKRIFLTHKNQPLFSICMAPCYHNKHPRYAPTPVVVVTWHYDVEQVRKNDPLIQKIRAAMFKGYGGPYDADELMLSLTP